MKWNKFKPENPPSGLALFRFENESSILYAIGYCRLTGLILYGAELKYLSTFETYAYNAHWIYPQDLEMPE